MTTKDRDKLVVQVRTEILHKLHAIAQTEGRPLEMLVDQALSDLIEKRKDGKPRAHVMAAYESSLERFGSLYKKLAERRTI